MRAGRQAVRKALAGLILLLACLFAPLASAQDAKPLRGVALAIGQSDYSKSALSPLQNPKNDAREITKLLIDLGFEARAAVDLDSEQLERQIGRFAEDAKGADVAVLYYSGHGVQASGENYLIPVDAGHSGLADPEADFISLTQILNQLRASVPVVILLLDACRNNPYGAVGLADTNVKETDDNLAMVLGFASAPGTVAYDDPKSSNSPYAAAILRHLGALKGASLGDVMTMITEEVYLKTQGRQRPWVNMSLRRLLYFGEAAPIAATDDDALRDQARRELALSIAATPQYVRAEVENLAQSESLPLDQLYGMLKELKVDTSAGRDELDKQLRRGAENLRKLLAEKALPLRNDPKLIELAGLADRAQTEGAIALAKDYRSRAALRADELDKTLDRREAEVIADRIELASTYADYAATAILAFDFRLAGEQYRKSYEQVEGKDNALAFKYKLAEADAFADHGDYKGDDEALKASLALYATALSAAERGNDRDNWALVQNNLGNALTRLGEREVGTDSLLKAVTVYEAALTEWTIDRKPLAWAATQNNLGTAFQNLGEREAGTTFLSKAVAAYQAALTQRRRESTPFDWAMTQNNLGNAFASLSEHETGIVSIDKAVAAYEAALAELSRERTPLPWALVQYSLGTAFTRRGERETGTDSLRKAVTAFEAALTVRTPERLPFDWALTQSNLGYAFTRLTERESSTTSIRDAVKAYEAALTVLTPKTAPLNWATAQNNLGSALRMIGEQENDTRSLRKAVAAYDAVLTVWRRTDVPLKWAATQTNLGNVLSILAEREGDTALFSEAVAAYRAALTVQTRKDAPLHWATTQSRLGSALLALGLMNGDRQMILDGRQATESAWDFYRSAGHTAYDDYFREQLQAFDAALAALPQ